MDENTHTPEINRRRLLLGLAATSAGAVAVAGTTIAVAAVPVAPAFDLQHWLDTADPVDVAHYHATRLAETMNRINPGQWFAKIDNAHEFVLIDRKAGPGTTRRMVTDIDQVA